MRRRIKERERENTKETKDAGNNEECSRHWESEGGCKYGQFQQYFLL